MHMPSIEQPLLGGTDGFRAEATEETGPGKMNVETVAGLTRALIEYQRDLGFDGPVVLAQDTRPSGDTLRSAARAGAHSVDAEVIDAGILPTPGAQKLADRVGALATVVITASHNPWTDNGWKGMLGNRKPSRTEMRAISDRYWQQTADGLALPHDLSRGTVPETTVYAEEYTDAVVRDITREFGESPLNNLLFVVDGARGAARSITPEVFHRLGARVEVFACDDDGYINDGCGAASMGGVKEFLRSRPDIMRDPTFVGAVANDGDADRLMAVGLSEHGELVDITGNHIMETLALQPKQPGIVGTTYTNSAVPSRLREQGIDFTHCANGDAHVTNTLLEKQADGLAWQRGGEFTGHLIDTAWLGSGDGVRMAAWLAAYAARSNQTFGDLAGRLPMWPEKMERVTLPANHHLSIDDSKLIQSALSKVIHLGARPVVRASGTEPVVRIWCEAPDQSLVTEANSLLRESVLAEMEEK